MVLITPRGFETSDVLDFHNLRNSDIPSADIPMSSPWISRMDDRVTRILSQIDGPDLCQGFQSGLTRSPVHRNANILTPDASISKMYPH
jgi:hypothetical protein